MIGLLGMLAAKFGFTETLRSPLGNELLQRRCQVPKLPLGQQRAVEAHKLRLFSPFGLITTESEEKVAADQLELIRSRGTSVTNERRVSMNGPPGPTCPPLLPLSCCSTEGP